jgi:hypothetical protein
LLNELLAAVEMSALPTALRASRYAYPVVNAMHFLGIGALFGSILALDLRLLGLGGAVPARPLAIVLPRVAGGGLALAVLTGLMLFSVQPFDYVDNRAFLLKITLVSAGAAHALYVHTTSDWRDLMRGSGDIDRRLKVAATISLAIWVAAILAGRFIAF